MGVRDNGPNHGFGAGMELMRLNYCWFLLLFSLADAIVDPIEEGEETEPSRVKGGGGGANATVESCSPRGRLRLFVSTLIVTDQSDGAEGRRQHSISSSYRMMLVSILDAKHQFTLA
jgi:hypothetical protein